MKPARPKSDRETARTIAFVKEIAGSRKILEQGLNHLRETALNLGGSTRGLHGIERDLEKVARLEQVLLRSCVKRTSAKRRHGKSA